MHTYTHEYTCTHTHTHTHHIQRLEGKLPGYKLSVIRLISSGGIKYSMVIIANNTLLHT